MLAGFKGVSHTKPGTLLQTQIPVRTWSECDEITPRFVEIDLVGHERGNSFGEFCFTLTVTDIATGWTVNRSVANKSAARVTEAIEHLAAASSLSPSSGSTRTMAANSSRPTCSSGAKVGKSPSPGPGQPTRTTAATSNRRIGPTSANLSAT